MDLLSGRIIKILLSVSLLSLLFSSLPLLFQSLNQFSINKSYVFLFCNGLMVFIARNSSLPDDSSSAQFKDLGIVVPVTSQEHDVLADSPEQEKEEEEEEQEEEKRVIMVDSQEEDAVADTEEEEEEEKRVIMEDSQEEDQVTDTAEKELVDETDIEHEVAETEKEEEEGRNGVWMTEEEEDDEVEELNKKCEDFIRQMKAAFCSELGLTSYGYNPDVDHQTAIVTMR
ncbi:X-linked retinitis pigmentosa GTPase regulator-interacting protein 1-like isoform X2 [Neltuma alba]|uniref:X-linked retinitis pigmentosa GTPase regulator-interacting protein 1-like isoform X2 n=1 Tax=Neltuma alba TaxID=207710 RepID=UPI0010A3BD37|nr:X-linked retinitis pigmentosa GTPase regulator-interacting protein 1-like isoform X2 [Prosopis alba]